MLKVEMLGSVLGLLVFRGEFDKRARGCARAGALTVSDASVEEDLGDFCSIWRDFDDVGVSATGTAAS
jgi:hypothetical protein